MLFRLAFIGLRDQWCTLVFVTLACNKSAIPVQISICVSVIEVCFSTAVVDFSVKTYKVFVNGIIFTTVCTATNPSPSSHKINTVL